MRTKPFDCHDKATVLAFHLVGVEPTTGTGWEDYQLIDSAPRQCLSTTMNVEGSTYQLFSQHLKRPTVFPCWHNSILHLQGAVGHKLYSVGKGNRSAGGALASGVDNGLDGSVDLREGHLHTQARHTQSTEHKISVSVVWAIAKKCGQNICLNGATTWRILCYRKVVVWEKQSCRDMSVSNSTQLGRNDMMG